MKKSITRLTRCILLVLLFSMTGCSYDSRIQKIYYSSSGKENDDYPYVQVEVRYDKSGGIHIECHTDCKEPVTFSVYHEKETSTPPVF